MRTNLLLSLVWILSVFAIHQGFASTCDDVTSDNVYIKLENYNGWNLPFAKSVNISSTDPSKNVFPIGQYLLDFDPSATFSVVFIETGLDNTGSENITLNYTFYGKTDFLQINGVWRDLTVQIFDDNSNTYSVDLRMFVSINTPPEAGLQGVIGLAQTNAAFRDYSFMYQIAKNCRGFPTQYMRYSYHAESYQTFSGGIRFENDANKDGMLEVGSIDVGKMVSEIDLPTQAKVNPFLLYKLENLNFNDMLIQNNHIYFEDFGSEVYLTTATQGIHLPKAIYTYMETIFFKNLCVDPSKNNKERNFLPLKECQCDGKNFFGMPSITFQVDNPASQDQEVYNMNADDILLFPKVDINLRQTYCNLGLWNLVLEYDAYNDVCLDFNDPTTCESDKFALGQVFILQFGLLLKWEETSESEGFKLKIYIDPPNKQGNQYSNWATATVILIALSIYVAVFSAKKFQRIKIQTEQYKKIKVLSLADYQLEVSPEFLAQMKNQQADLDFLHGKEGAKTAVDYSQSNTADLLAQRVQNRISTTPTAFASARKSSLKSSMTKQTKKAELLSRKSHKKKRAESMTGVKRDKEE